MNLLNINLLKKILLLFMFSFLFFSCKKTTSEPFNKETNLLIGNWKNQIINDSIFIFTRTSVLIENEYGFTFKPNNQFVERKNTSWCGTPPVTFNDYQGIWAGNDSIINITVAYWGGLADYQWKIISVDNHNLKVYKIKENFRSNF